MNRSKFLLSLLAACLVTQTLEASFPGLNGEIAFTSRRDTGTLTLFTMMPDGSLQARIRPSTSPEFFPSYSSDGTQLLFVRDVLTDNKIYRMNEDGTGEVLLTGPGDFNTTPVWSPGGGFVAFATNRTGVSNIFVMFSNGVFPFPLTTDATVDSDPAWSPDGSRIAFTRNGANQEIVVREIFGTESVIPNQSANDRSASWSPDGTRITFVSDRSGNADVYIMDADGSNVSAVTTDGGFDNAPVWSPDGTLIAFTSDRNGGSDIYVKNADGTGVATRLTFTGDNGGPDWQPVPPAAATASIRDSVSTLVTTGALTRRGGRILDRRLAGAMRMMELLRLQPSINRLQTFNNLTNNFVNTGRLTSEQAQPLIDSAQAIIDYIETNGL